MPYYVRMGQVPNKRHTQVRKSDGSLYSEEVVGAAGFSGMQSIVYHVHPPTVVTRWEDPIPYGIDYVKLDYLRHRHIKGFEASPSGDWLSGRTYIMGNDDVRLALCAPVEEMSFFYRNAVADEMIFVHEGEGVLESPFGRVEFSPGDYVHIPRTVTHKWIFTGEKQARLFVIEAFSEIHPPKRYRNEFGQLLEHSPFCERDLRPPSELITIDEQGEFEVRVAKHNHLHRLFFRYHPFDVVGWDGYMYPYATSIHDFEPITGRIHMPPPIHQHFEGRNFVICSFVPRLFDYHPEAIPAPYNHSNIDSDEVLYYVDGDFMSRKGIDRGSFTLHPGGIAHGPHPGTVEASIGKKGTEELAVMVDTFRPLQLTKAAVALEDEDYMLSWRPETHGEYVPSDGQ